MRIRIIGIAFYYINYTGKFAQKKAVPNGAAFLSFKKRNYGHAIGEVVGQAAPAASFFEANELSIHQFPAPELVRVAIIQ